MSNDKFHPRHMVNKLAKITASLDAYDIHQETMARLRGHIGALDMLIHKHPEMIDQSEESGMILATLSAVREQAMQLESSAEALLALASKREAADV